MDTWSQIIKASTVSIQCITYQWTTRRKQRKNQNLRSYLRAWKEPNTHDHLTGSPPPEPNRTEEKYRSQLSNPLSLSRALEKHQHGSPQDPDAPPLPSPPPQQRERWIVVGYKEKHFLSNHHSYCTEQNKRERGKAKKEKELFWR